MSVRAKSWQVGLALLAAVGLGITLPGAPASAAPVTGTFTGTVDSASSTTWAQTFAITVGDLAVDIQASLDWVDPAANLNLFLTAPGSTTSVVQVVSNAKPKTLTYHPLAAGTYKLRVKATKGASAFTLSATYGSAAGAGTAIASYAKTYGYADTKSVFPYGMEFDSSDNTVLAGDYWNFRIKRYSAATGAIVGSYKNVALTGVGAAYDIAIDPFDTPATGKSNFWVADQEQGVVVEFDHDGKVLRQLGVGGTGSDFHPRGCGNGAMTNPTHVVIDPRNGNMYISDVVCKNVWEYAHDGTFLRGFVWTGWKTATGFNIPTPRGIQMDENGNVYVLELNSRRVVVFNPDELGGGYQRVFPYQADMNDPRGLDIDRTHGFIYAVGALRQIVFKYDYAGTLLKRWDSPDGTFGVKTAVKFNSIRSPAVDPATGNVYFGDTWAYRVYAFTSDAAPVWASAPMPPSNGGYTQQTGVALDSTGRLFVTGSFDQRVQAFETAGGLDCRSETTCAAFNFHWGTRVNVAPNATGFDYPKAMVYTDDKLWIGEGDGADIQIYDRDGNWIHRFGLQGPAVGQFRGGVFGVYVEGGHVFATDTGNCRLQVFDEAAVLATTSGLPVKYMGSCGQGPTQTASQMGAPRGVVAQGNTAYVVETGGGRISVWDWTTQTKTASYRPSCGGSLMSSPWGAAWDPSHTWIYIGDKGRARVVRWSPTTQACEVVTTGGDTPEGSLSGPDFLNFGPDGKLYVSDNNKRVYSFTITG